MDERWLTVDDNCKYLDVSNEMVYKWVVRASGHAGPPGRVSMYVQAKRS